jgi:long-chain fatty acid transport protein
MNYKSTTAMSVLATLGYASAAWANGLTLNEQSASTMGTAYAGRASSAIDASTIYGNPAGMSKLVRREVTGGLAVVAVRDRISDAHGEASGTNEGNSVPLSAIPFGYAAIPVDAHFAFGVGVYVPFGLVNQYEDAFQGRYHGSFSKVQVKTVQPTLSYRITPSVSVGAGVTINRIENNLQTYLATGALNGGKDTHITILGDDMAIGSNLGVMVELGVATTWGATYHSKSVFHASGYTAVRESPAAFGVEGRYPNSIATTMPESFDTSLTHHFNERWTGHLGATWTRWSRIQRTEAINSGVSPLGMQLGFGNFGDNFRLHSTWALAMGAAYQYSPEWLLRAGYAYDQKPTNDTFRTVRVPVGNRRALTLGAGYTLSPDMVIDMAYGYLHEPATQLNQPNLSGVQPGYSAVYHNSGHILSAQLTYRF